MKKGFTLAEVLITLGVIGVVAVLTVPNLVSNYQKKVYVAQLQKVYNQISNAVSLLMVDEEVDNLNETSLYCGNEEESSDCVERVSQFLKKYFKISKDCGNLLPVLPEGNDCVVTSYKRLNGEWFIHPYGYCVIINSGAVLCIESTFTFSKPLVVNIDFNGVKGPNTWGRDAFRFSVNYQGEIAESFAGYPDHMNSEVNGINDPNRCFEKIDYSEGCFTKIINDGWKMDY